jgi:two-component system, OmpR family, sensor kinase
MRPKLPHGTPLRTRVLVGVLLVTLVAITVFDVAAVTALRRYLYAQTDSQLASVVSLYRPFSVPLPPNAVPPGVNFVGGRGTTVNSKTVKRQFTITGPRLVVGPAVLDQYLVEFVGPHGPERPFVIGRNADLQPRIPANLRLLAAHRRAETVPSRNGHAQLRLLSMHLGGGILFVTTSLSGVSKTVGRLELILIIGSVCAALLVALGVALVLRRGLRPIEAMATDADRITAGDLTDRVAPHDTRTEVGRLGDALNGMLARIETSVREREASQELTNRFFADASHELRTPLASLRANAELYTQGALTERAQVDEAMRRIVIESQRMSKLVDDMLRLARLDQHPGQRYEAVDVTALVAECYDDALIADPQRIWDADIADGLTAIGDAELLRRAVSNLMSNVRTHTPAGTAAVVTAARVNGSVKVSVGDNGPGVPDDQLPRIFDRFYRGGTPSPRPGAGLGLAIVAAIATAHEGTTEATPNDPNGLRVTLTVPAATPTA